MYDPRDGIFLSVDPMGLAIDPNTYRYVDNDPTNFVDPTGMAEVSDTIRVWKGSIADADKPFTTTPFAELAKFVNSHETDQNKSFHPVIPQLTEAGPFSYSNSAFEFNNATVQKGWLTGRNYLVFFRWDIKEGNPDCSGQFSDPIRIRVGETRIVSHSDGTADQKTIIPPQILSDSFVKANLRKPEGGFTRSLIYVDAPGIMSVTTAFPGAHIDYQIVKVDQTIELLDKNNTLLKTEKWTLTIGLDKNGKPVSSP